MNIFIKELKSRRKSLFFWSLGIIFVIAMGMTKYSGYAAAGQSINSVLAQMPQSIRMIFGMGNADLSKASGYFGWLFLFIEVLAAIHAVVMGAGSIASEEQDKTSEFLFVKPVSRDQVVSAKMAAILVNIVVLNLVTLCASVLIFGHFSQGETLNGQMFQLMLSMFLIQMFFAACGTFFAAVLKNAKAAVPLANAVVLISFILYILIGLSTSLNFLRILTPFKYFEIQALLQGQNLDPGYILFSLLIITLLAILTFRTYRNRDLAI